MISKETVVERVEEGFQNLKGEKNGTYKYNRETGRLERISDGTTVRNIFDCFVPQGGYWSENLSQKPGDKVFVESRAHKRRLLSKRGLRETG